jgi:ankyrin repeat protein
MWKLLIATMIFGDELEAKKLIAIMTPEMLGTRGMTPCGYSSALHIAINLKMEEVSKLLILKMYAADTNLLDQDGRTTLMLAIFQGMESTCTLLIPRSATTNIVCQDYTALDAAVIKGMNEVAKLLVPKADSKQINRLDKNGNTILHLSILKGMEDVSILLAPKMNTITINLADENGNTALHLAVIQGMYTLCKFLIPQMSRNAINNLDQEGNTVIHLLCYNAMKIFITSYKAALDHIKKNTSLYVVDMENIGQDFIIKLAINNGFNIDINLSFIEGIIKLLIPKMSSLALNTHNENGESILCLLAYAGFENLFEPLIPKFTSKTLNKIGEGGFTVLHWTTLKGLSGPSKLLISKMNSQAIDAVTHEGSTALQWAILNNMEEVSKLLISKMSFQAINNIDKNGNTALHAAIAGGMEEVSLLLIHKMAPETIGVINSRGETALSLAEEKGMKLIYELITRILNSNEENALEQNEPVQELEILEDEIVAQLVDNITTCNIGIAGTDGECVSGNF